MVLWTFPSVWYTRRQAGEARVWLRITNRVAGWRFEARALSQAAEAELAADRFWNGEFSRSDGTVARAYVAEASTDAGTAAMFGHTPDRCWTGVGWTLEPASPETVQITIQGLPVSFERRVFKSGTHRELVYFTALVDGRQLPFRLDQFYEVGLRRGGRLTSSPFAKTISALNGRFFVWPWKVFFSRRPLTGAKQFIRVSTPVQGRELEPAEAVLQDFLNQWLKCPGNS